MEKESESILLIQEEFYIEDKKGLILIINGNIDIETNFEIKKKLYNILSQEEVKYLLINLEKVTFINSNGFGMFAYAYKVLKSRGGNLGVFNVLPEIVEIFNVLKLNTKIQISKTRAEALEKLKVN